MQHAPPPPLAPQCSMGGHDAPASPARLTVSHTSSPPAKQRSLDGRALSPPPSRLQPTGGRASVPPIHLRVSTGCAPSQPSVDARHPYWPPAPPQPTEGCASVLPPVSRQPTPISSDSPTPSSPPQHPEWFPASQRPLLWVRDICSGARFLVDSGAEPCAQPTPSLTTLRQATQFEALLQEFPLLTFPQSAPPRVQQEVQHSIVTAGPPCFAWPRRLPPECLYAARKEFDLMLEEGIVRPSDSNLTSPLHMVPKA
ncbi:vegetative cell wall protein gp1-like [Portunus trituberculatus]|uniref:vegetative cell wall protein gp1-like n=1 Tax=Portunus trituberculatus TaxID=210409 RepID=UPI001E1D1D98|nr:vegetative cell wall protein gp1-like [Portunus trituberculatus]